MRITLIVIFTLAALGLPLPLPLPPASGEIPGSPKNDLAAAADPVQQALEEDLQKSEKLPGAVKQKAEEVLSALRKVALYLIGLSFIAALVKTAYGAVRGYGELWPGLLAAAVSALCFVAVMHAKTILYLVTRFAAAP